MSSQKPFTRKVQDLGNGCLGVSIPAGAAEKLDIEAGDELGVDLDWDAEVISFRTD